MNIHGIGPISPLPVPAAPGTVGGKPGGFENVFREAVQTVEAQRREAHASVDAFLRGENEELHTAALAIQRAEMSFELFLQVRNKVVQAYQEVMRMQI